MTVTAVPAQVGPAPVGVTLLVIVFNPLETVIVFPTE
jgi:hypothetical protein